MKKPNKNHEPMHPGKAFKAAYIKNVGDISALSERIGLSRSYIGEILQGKRPVNAKIALAFETISIESAVFWAQMQAAYDVWFQKNRGYWRR